MAKKPLRRNRPIQYPKRVIAAIPEELEQQAQEHSKKHSISVSEIVRRALRSFLQTTRFQRPKR